MNKSILDQVMLSQKISALSTFDAEEVARKLFSVLSDREEDIIVKRYGLSGQPKITLEEIGNHYAVTRERIRQVENASLKKIKDSFENDVLKNIEFLIQSNLEDQGDIMTEKRLTETLLHEDQNNDTNSALIKFILNQLIYDRLQMAKESLVVYKAWSLQSAPWTEFHQIIDYVADVIEKHGEPMKLEHLVDKTQNKISEVAKKDISPEVLLMNYLDITKKIEENKFNEWGLSHWSAIRPKRMNDKIFLILKRENKPLHFVEIAKKINDAKFDNRVAYPATIHNELILDKKYVLVGRGIYALRDWGYKPGVVLDVIKEILKQNGKPMSRDEIIAEVLKNRLVKRSTVVLALMNKQNFNRDENGNYTLASAQ